MDRNREARRSNMATTNGLSRRRQRTNSLRDSHEEDEEMELQDTVRLRDRANKRDRDRDRDRDRERDRYRDREFSNHKLQNKRRRGDSLTQGEEESTEESVADEEEYEIEERRLAHDTTPHNTTSFSSSLSNQNSRKTLPPTSRHMRQTPALKAADEMIGFTVPRKARSVSVKRSHENWASGNGGFWEDHRASTSSASRSVEANSPSSSNVSVRKNMKSNGPKTRLPKVAKSSNSVQQEDIEIEIAEVLFGLMKQSQNSKKENDSTGKIVKKLESKDGINTNQETNLSVSVLTQKDSPASDLLHVVGSATKKKKKVEVDNSSNQASTVKAEGELPPKMEISASILGKTFQSNVVSSEASNEIDAPKVASTMVEPQEEVGKLGDKKSSIEGSDCPGGPETENKLTSGDKESTCCKMDSTVTKASSTVLETDSSPKVEKFKIDLMALPEMDGFNDCASDPTVTAQDVDMKSSVKDEEKAERLVKKEPAVQEAEEKKIEPIEEKIKLKFDLEKPNQDDGRYNSIKLQQQSNKQEEPTKATVSKVEKTGQSGSLPLQVAVAGWPNGFQPLGYIPPFQTIMPMDGSARSATTQQPSQFMLSQPRPKRCATHHYIARNILLNQQVAKMNLFWSAGASSTSSGAKSSNLNVISSAENLIHGNQLQGSFPAVSLNSVHDKGQALHNFSGPTQKDKSSESVNFMDPVQRKQLVLQQAPHPAPAGNFLHAPAFIFPVSQQQAVITAAANQSGPSKSATSARSASLSGNSTAAMPGSSTAVAAAVNYNYPNLAANEAPYFTVVQNNGYPFPVPTPIGTPPAIRGAHAQALPFFNGSFYSSQIFHPSQLQQQQPPHSQSPMQATYQNTTTSSASSSSHKQTQAQQSRGVPVSGNNLLNSTTMLPHQPQKQHVTPSNQNRKLEAEMSGENAPSLADSRTSHNQTSAYGQSFTVPFQPFNFALMPSPIVGSGGAGGNHSEKQQQSQQKSLKGGVELIPQAFAMSFASFGGNNTASNLNFSSMAQNPPIFHSLPEMARQGYQVAPTGQAVQQKNHQISDVKTGVSSSNHDDGKKTGFGKSPTSNGQTLVFDNSARTLNFVSSPVTGNWPSRSITSTAMTTSASVAANSQNFQQQQLLKLQKQQMLQQQQQSAATARSKAPSANNLSSSSIATKVSNNASMFPQTLVQCNSSSQSPQWKNSTRATTCQVPPASHTSSNTSTLKNVSQQQVRSPQGQTQISFERNSKSSLAPQGQQIPTSNQSPSSLVVGSPPSGGNLKTSSAGSKAGSSVPTLQPQQTENSSASTGQKNSPVCGRNVPSILSACPSHLSELKY